jgi:hypothetical protein
MTITSLFAKLTQFLSFFSHKTTIQARDRQACSPRYQYFIPSNIPKIHPKNPKTTKNTLEPPSQIITIFT